MAKHFEKSITVVLERLEIPLDNITHLLHRQARVGDSVEHTVSLNNERTYEYKGIFKDLQELAHYLQELYGVRVQSPALLVQYLR